MKGILKFLVFVAIIIAIIVMLAYWREGQLAQNNPPPPQAVAQAPTPIPTLPPPTPDPRWVKQQQQQVQQATQRFNQMRSAAAAPASNSNLYSRLQAIARRTGVTITRFSESGNRASITVQGPSHVQLGNFIDQVTRAGITNDPGPANLRPVMVNGRRLMETTYNIPLL